MKWLRNFNISTGKDSDTIKEKKNGKWIRVLGERQDVLWAC